MPALDGMRGLALLGMLAWHAQIDWVKGGFARMTIFFVLAGYLAAASQLRILDRAEARPFLAFWARRARRLMPITVLGVLVALGATAAVGGAIARGQALGDSVSVLFSYSNWRFIVGAREYGAMFEASSAFQHYWSLSVEEQCFIVLPLVLASTRWLTRRIPDARRHGAAAAWLAALAAVLAATPLVVTMSADAAYYSTVVRGGEFVAGAAFAVWWSGLDRPVSPHRRLRWDVAGVAGLGALLVVMTTMERDHAWLYRGGMGLFAIPTIALLGGIVAGGPVVNRILGIGPLATLGRWAFPVYVLHWPLFLVMDSRFPSAPRVPLVVAELALSIALGGLVHHTVERPLMTRSGRVGTIGSALLWRGPRRAVGAAASAVAVCVLAAHLVPAGEPAIDFAAAERDSTTLSLDEARELLEAATAAAADGAPHRHGDSHVTLTPERVAEILGGDDVAQPGLPVMRDPARTGVALFGGSTALTIALGGETLGEIDPTYQAIPGYSPLGCGVLDEGVRGSLADPPDPEPPNPVPKECRERGLRWAATAVAHQVDVAVVAASLMDTLDWQLTEGAEWTALGDPSFDRTLADAMRSIVEDLHAVGVEQVVFLTPIPPPERMPTDARLERLGRQDRYAALVREVAAETGAVVVDLAAWVRALPSDERVALTPDGVHPHREGARRIWTEILGPALSDLPRHQPSS